MVGAMRPRALAALIVAVGLVTTAASQADGPFESPAPVAARNRVDELVFARLKQLGIQPARVSSDAVFLRRAYLDVIGTLPTGDEARAFLADRDPNKRAALVDRLLVRDEFADFWAMRWCEVLRVKSEFPINLWPNAVQAYHRWIRTAIRDNVPYDRFARDLLTSSGSNFHDPEANFYRALQGRAPEAIASTVALTFMGVRTDTWPKDRLANMAAFFSQIGYKSTGEWKEEIVFFDADKTLLGGSRTLVYPDGSTVPIERGQDPREAFAAWLVAPANPWFARAMVNRAWFWLLGRGIVQEPDDLRPDNPPANPELLAFLEREFVASRFDLKRLYRLILNSTTYQLSPIPHTDRPEGEADFAFALLRPLEAEVLVDAIDQITGTHEQYSSPIPEPYTFVPPEVRSIALSDGSITSTFLVTFGRPPRDSGRASESVVRPTAAQRLYLLNSSDIQRKIQQGPAIQALIQAVPPAVAITNLYVAVLSRLPTDAELRAAAAYVQMAGANRRALLQDLVWSLVNTAEFRFRH
jgi:hypothetical protein